MGLADRDYYGRPPRSGPPPRPVGPLAGAPVTKALLIANIAVFIIDMLLHPSNVPYGPLTAFGAFTVDSAVFHGRIWEFITFQFLHANVGHILFNSIGLYFFGPFMERWWGDRLRFLVFYLACGVAGGLFFTILMLGGIVRDASIGTPLIGASAGIYGLLIGTAMIAPQARVQLLFPPVELSMRTFALGLMGIAVFMILTNLHNAGGEAGHLGGAIAAYFFVKYPDFLRLLGGHRRGKVDVIPPKAFRRGGAARSGSKVVAKSDPEIDRILDKIRSEGLQSLSEKERRKLREAAGD